jgi:hypothetical protein
MKKHLYILLTIICVLNSCKKSTKEIESSYLSSAISNLNIDNRIKWIVVLPGLGCNGCIQEAEAFMRDNIELRDVFFVLTNISSLKILQQKIGVKVKNCSNVYVDNENLFKIPTDNCAYPCIIEYRQNKYVNHEFQSPRNGDAFRKLKERIMASN